MTVYEFLIHASQAYTSIIGGGKTDELIIDLPSKSIRSGKLHILCDGQFSPFKIDLADGQSFALDGLIDFEGDPYAEIERLYAQFTRSVPSRHEKLNRGNFKALSSDALTMEELTDNMPRVEARYRLEGFILLTSIIGLIPWRNPRHFFWQSTTDLDLIIYRNWILKEDTTYEPQAC